MDGWMNRQIDNRWIAILPLTSDLVYSLVASADSFGDVRTNPSRLPSFTEDQRLSRSPPGFQCHIGPLRLTTSMTGHLLGSRSPGDSAVVTLK